MKTKALPCLPALLNPVTSYGLVLMEKLNLLTTRLFSTKKYTSVCLCGNW